MLDLALHRLGGPTALGALILRVGLVGVNFAVMLALAARLGLAGFGALIFLWGQALVFSTVVSCGGPLVLSRDMAGKAGLGRLQIVSLIFVRPAVMSGAVWLVAMLLRPDLNLGTVLAAAYMINLLTCLASVMRAFGSIQLSMLLRDAGPFVALGVAGFAFSEADGLQILWAAALIMAAMMLAASAWCVLDRSITFVFGSAQRFDWHWSLWGTSVLGMLLAQIDLLIGGFMLQNHEFGLYAFLRRIANLVALPVSVATWISSRRIAAAQGANDSEALQRASAEGSQIAWYAGLGIALLAFAGLCFAALIQSHLLTPFVAMVFVVLVVGALVQAFFASGLTVATLGGQAWVSTVARACSLGGYTVLTLAIGAGLTPMTNALAYVGAIFLGSLLVWWVLWRRLGVDTSAMALWTREVRNWRTS